MAYTEKRTAGFIGRYRKDGTLKSTPVFSTRDEAMAAAQAAEGIVPSKTSGTTLRNFFLHTWPTHTDVAARTREDYTRTFLLHIDPALGNRSVESIKRFEVRMMLADLQAKGMKPITALKVKSVLGSIYKTLLDLELVETSPTINIRISGANPREFEPVDTATFRKIKACLPNPECALLATVLVTSGLRYGEVAELRVRDINFRTEEILVTRRMVRLTGFSGAESRFRAEAGTKGGHNRNVSLSSAVIREIQQHVRAHGLGDDDLVFPKSLLSPSSGRQVIQWKGEITIPEGLPTWTRGGRTFQHGTTYSYGPGGCRCEHCRNAENLYRRAQRQARREGKDPTYRRAVPEGRAANTTGHLPSEDWGKIWRRACKASGIGWTPRTHDLRHAHATHLVESGVDIYEVKERLGHASVTTTEIYKHRSKKRQSGAVTAADDFL